MYHLSNCIIFRYVVWFVWWELYYLSLFFPLIVYLVLFLQPSSMIFFGGGAHDVSKKESGQKCPTCRGIWRAVLRITLRKTCYSGHSVRRGIQGRKWGRRFESYPSVVDVQQTYCVFRLFVRYVAFFFNENNRIPPAATDKLTETQSRC